jgi:YrbI family 3-deoxy-D-manno-octulosonate 8-phosphate phosphatase
VGSPDTSRVERESGRGTPTVALVDAFADSRQTLDMLTTRTCGEYLFLQVVYAAVSAASIGRVLLFSNRMEICEIARQREIPDVVAIRSDYTGNGHIVDRMFAIPLGDERLQEQMVICLSARRPLVTSEDIDQFVAMTSAGAEDGVFSAAEIDLSSIRECDGRTLPPRKGFAETGALYAFRRASLERAGTFAKLNVRPCLLPGLHSLPVETTEDLEFLAHPQRRQPIDQSLQHHPVRALVLDFDGVFTDNKVIVAADGAESAVCDRSDGFAIQALQRRGFPILVLSTETVPIVRMRCQKLGLECIHSTIGKLAALQSWLSERNIDPEHAIYVGNDVNDVECMKFVGLPFAVADAFPEVRAVARHVLSSRGGHGAVREIALAVTSLLDGRRWQDTSGSPEST